MQTAQPAANKVPAAVLTKVGECLYRNDSSGIYYALVKRSGKQFRKSLKSTDRALAQRRLVEFREKVGRLSQTKGANQITFEQVADRWLETIRGNMKSSSALRRQISITQLKPFFGKKTVRSLAAGDCDEWVIKRGNKISASSFNNERDTLIQILDYAKRDGLILNNPAREISRRKMAKPNIVIPTREQFKLLVETMRQPEAHAAHGANLIELLAYTGMRLAEATSLTWLDMALERGVFIVTGGELGTKNLEARTVPIFPAMHDLLLRLKAGSTPRPLDKVIPILSAKKALIGACKRAELPHFTHHCLRHYFVSNAIEAGIDFKVIAGWIGHKDGGVLVAKTYGHLRDAHSFEMAKRMTFSAQDQQPSNVVSLASAQSG